MIGKKHRFHGYGSLKYVYSHGQTVRGPLFSIKTVANPKRSSYRLAVVVSRKVAKSAVKRNRIRRRLFEAVRQFEAQLLPQDIIITVFHETVIDLPSKQLSEQVKKQLKTANVLGVHST